MSDLNKLELAWAAGFYDGEGCTGFTAGRTEKGRRYPRLAVQITQHESPETLERFKAAVGGFGSIYGPYKRDDRTPQWKYIASHRQADVVLSLLLPYLSGPKTKQARSAMAQREAARILPRRTPIPVPNVG